MFTGIVEEVGTVAAISRDGDAALLKIVGTVVSSDAQHGASIAVNGVCLTVVDYGFDFFTADVMGETLQRSSLGALTEGSAVNLERAVTAATRLSGHIVQGHVDGVGQILSRTPHNVWEVVRVSLPPELSAYVVEKGSITIDGISLTVSGVSEIAAPEQWLEVSLIPTTMKLTTLGAAEVGAPVNLEVDVLAKYVERQIAGIQSRTVSLDAVTEQENI
ncbi:riboflavin synthase alpha chain [Antricoccus suffuscus]|uniref:Riboflavin synthase n=1 Tax=Antricoccus suffuscus TaxID=1629062 RepID=A0A2T0ZWF9_9ACTN|nr:riboflavin synthase alpha chain [Antricoccus suffuscus]